MVGAQLPRLSWVPGFASSRGREAVEWAASVGLMLDPWQQFVLENSLGVRDDGLWAAFEVGLDVARQNGKGGILEAREGAGLFEFGEGLLLHSCHNFSTSLEAFMRMETLLESNAELSAKVRKVNRSNTEWGFKLFTGARIQYRTRTKGGARGFSADFIAFDEAMFLPEHAIGAMMPTVSAMPNPQIWYTGSAVDQQLHDEGIVFARVRERGLKGGDPRLAYFEWSADVGSIGDLTDAQLADERLTATANPGLGIRISPEHVENERRSMDARTFAVERLGVGDWPATDGTAGAVISLDDWMGLADARSSIEGGLVFAFDVSPDRQWSDIAAAGFRADGSRHVEIVEHRRGTAWVSDRLDELVEKHDPTEILRDPTGPAGAITVNVDVREVTAREHANACGLIFDLIEQRDVHHLGTPELQAAVKGATKRPLGDAWAWSRKNSQVNISPLVAATLALFGTEGLDDDARGEFVLDTRQPVAA